MATTTKIHVTRIDNELYILAVNGGGTASSEICHLKANTPVDFTIVPQSILPPGNYTLILVGINWGGAQAFTIILTTGGVDTTLTAPPSTNIGANFTKAVQITV